MDVPFNIFDQLPRDCWVTIDTSRLRENVRRLQAHVNAPLLVAVKANGYGHGYEHAARAFIEGGVSYLGVASLSEGLLLRRLGFTIPILVICGMLPPEMKLAASARLDFFVWRNDHINLLRDITDENAPARVHLKVDTGMGRAGCSPEEVPFLAATIQKIKGIELTGFCTHFASADDNDPTPTEKQIERFEQTITALHAANIRPRIIHAANSPGSLYFSKARYDMARFGITAYGIAPDEGLEIPAGIKPALSWHARLTSTKILPSGHGVGYGSEYKMPSNSRIGILPVGYGDGFQRVPKNTNVVLVEGQERRTLGRICMDQCMVDLGGFDDITGAEVILIGQQDEKEISVEDVARRWKTNPYDVYCGIASRVPRKLKA